MQPIIDDEGIRAVVAFEMDYNQDYITPTLGEKLYFKKPPVYNWILIAFKRISNDFSEFTLRLPTILFLLLFTFTIFYVLRKKYNATFAFLVSFMFLTSARILFYESLLGLIDMSYSWLIFINFILIYYYFRREKYFQLFVFSYALIAITFLMKGLTSVAFQGMTLVPFFIIEKRFKKLLSWQHFLGIFAFIAISGSYYLAYYFKNPEAIEQLLRTIIFESSDKSAIGAGTNKLVKHILTFPFEIIYHFAPWTLFLVFLFRKGAIKTVRKNPFLRFCSITFVANIIVYWMSPITYPRYLMPLIPLLFIILTFFLLKERKERTLMYRIIETSFLISIPLAIIASLSAPFLHLFDAIQHLWFKSIAIALMIIVLFYFFIKLPQKRIELLILFILVLRLGYNFLVIPKRGDESSWHGQCKLDAIEVGKLTKGEPLYLHMRINYKSYYYLEREREAPISYLKNPPKKGFHLIYDPKNKCKKCIKYKTLKITYEKRILDLIKYKTKNPQKKEL